MQELFGAVTDHCITDTISSLLASIVKQNQDIPSSPRLTTAHTVFASPWVYEWADVADYINRLKEWIVCSAESFVVATCLMKRLEAAAAIPPLTQRCVHRVFFTSLVLAVKVLEDETLVNSDFAKVGCVSAKQLARMELHALKALNFNCIVSRTEFDQCQAELQRAKACMEQQRKAISSAHRRGSAPEIHTNSRSSQEPSPKLQPKPQPKVEPVQKLTKRTSFFSLKLRTAKTAQAAADKLEKQAAAKTKATGTPGSAKTTPTKEAPPTKPAPSKFLLSTRSRSVASNLQRTGAKSLSLFATSRRKSCDVDVQQPQSNHPQLYLRTKATAPVAVGVQKPRAMLARQDSI